MAFRRTVEIHKGRMYNSSYVPVPVVDGNRRMENRKKLYVGNVPLNFTEDDICEIFEQFGCIMSVYIGTQKSARRYTYALVEYDSPVEEEKSRANMDKLYYECSDERTVQPRRHNFGRLANFNDDEVYSDEFGLFDDFDYDSEEVYDNSEHLHKKTNMHDLMMVVDSGGERQLTHKKAFKSSNFIIVKQSEKMRRSFDEAITSMMDAQKKSGRAGNSDSTVEENSGNCEACGTFTTTACTQCQLWYCSRKCQLEDWPRHKRLCEPIPDLQCKTKNNLMEPKDKESVFKHPSNLKSFKHNFGEEDMYRKEEGSFGFNNGNAEEKRSHFDNNKRSDNQNSHFEDRRNKRFGEPNKHFASDRNSGFGDCQNNGFGEDQTRGFGDDKNKGFGNDRNKGFGDDQNKGFGNDWNKGFVYDRNMGFGDDRNKGFGDDRNKGFGDDGNKRFGDYQNKGVGDNNKGFGDGDDQNKGFGIDRNKGFVYDRNRGFGDDRNRGFGDDRNKGFGDDRNKGFGDDGNKRFGDYQNKGVGDNNKGFEDDRSKGLGNRNTNFGEQNRSFEGRSKGFGNDKNNFENRNFEDQNINNFKNGKQKFGRTDSWKRTPPSRNEDAENTQFWDENVKTSTPVKTESLNTSSSKLSPASLLRSCGTAKEVIITVVIGHGHYYVVLKDMEASYKEMLGQLQEAAKNAELLVPVEKAKCIVYVDNVWLRGIIRSVSPLQVLLVDYGNSELFTTDVIKVIPEEFTKFPRMAFRIKIAPGVHRGFFLKNENDIFSVKATADDPEGAVIVEVTGTVSADIKINKHGSSKDELKHSLPPYVFTEVTVTVVESKTDYMVQCNSTLESVLGIMKYISQEISTAKPFTPVLGARCLGQFEGDWYRGDVISVSPLKLYFIDYGNEEECTLDQIRTISSKLSSIPPKAFKIHLAEGTPEEFLNKQPYDVLEVKPVSEGPNGVITVHVKGHNYSSTKPESVPIVTKPEVPVSAVSQHEVTVPSKSKTTLADSKYKEQKNVIDLLKVDYKGLLKIRKCSSTDEFTVTVVCSDLDGLNDTLLIKLPNALEQQAYDQSFKPKINQVVGVEYKDEQSLMWGRATQHLKDKFVLCDTGMELIPLQVKKMPSDYENLPFLAAFCVLQNSKELETDIKNTCFKVNKVIIFQVTKLNDDGSVEAFMISDNQDKDNLGKCTLKSWQPYSFVPRNVLKSGTNVTLAFFYDYDTFYILLEQAESLGFFDQLKEEVSAVPHFDKDPEIGSLVACQFSDDNEWYRATILKKIGNEYEVFFVDYGNKEITKLLNLKSLPPRFKDVPYHAIKVGLANKLNKSFTKEAVEYLSRISADEERLQIIFENDDLTSVVLQRASGKSINDELNTIMERDQKLKSLSEEKSETVSPKDFISIDDLPKYELAVGSEITLKLLLIIDPRMLVLCDSTSQVFCDVIKMTDKLHEYCQGLPKDDYKPVKHELCAAVYDEDGSWYRAVCLDTNETESKVLFIDYGNECTVKYSNMRKLAQEFSKTSAMSFRCIYDAMPKDCPKALKKRFEELVVFSHEYTLKVKSFDNNDGFYNIDIPSVTLTLQKEGLL